MSKVPMAIEELHRAEKSLAADLQKISDRHKADHEVHHVARDIARWSQEHVHALAEVGRHYGLDIDPDPPKDATLVTTARQKGDELLGRHHDASLLLLADLRKVHRDAAGVSLDWEVLAQTAQALKDTELLKLTKRCHPETLRQMRWANAKIKEASAQVMVTVPAQMVASVMAFLARDPVAATGMGILAGTWAAATLGTLTSPPGAASAGLGVILLASAAAMLVPAVAGTPRRWPAPSWCSAPLGSPSPASPRSPAQVVDDRRGWTGVALAALAFFTALAFELERTAKHDVLPLLRRGKAAAAVDTSIRPHQVLGDVARAGCSRAAVGRRQSRVVRLLD